MRRNTSILLANLAAWAILVIGANFASGCARSPAESFGMIGFKDMRVVFVSDSADVLIREESPRLLELAILPGSDVPETLVRTAAGQGLYTWGASCGSQFRPKRVTWDARMGLSHAKDGWNVGDAAVLRSYTRATNTDYIVVLNKVTLRRGQLARPDAGATIRSSFADVSLDISVIDAKEGKRVWRSPAQGRTESTDSLSRLAPKALDLAVDNFFAALPQVHRWGCRDLVDRFK
jgi:hypothetical protein